MSTLSYFAAWTIYILAGSVLTTIFWRFSKTWRNAEAVLLFRITLLICLFTPYYSDASQNRLAPALLITLFEAIFGDKVVAMNSANPLFLLLGIGCVITLISKYKRRSHANTN